MAPLVRSFAMRQESQKLDKNLIGKGGVSAVRNFPLQLTIVKAVETGFISGV